MSLNRIGTAIALTLVAGSAHAITVTSSGDATALAGGALVLAGVSLVQRGSRGLAAGTGSAARGI